MINKTTNAEITEQRLLGSDHDGRSMRKNSLRSPNHPSKNEDVTHSGASGRVAVAWPPHTAPLLLIPPSNFDQNDKNVKFRDGTTQYLCLCCWLHGTLQSLYWLGK